MSEPVGTPRPPWVSASLRALVIVVVFGVVGVGCGWLWYHLWDAPSGVVSGHQWFTNEAGLRADFDGVAWYVTIALAAGLVLGILAALLSDRSELVTLAAVVLGSVLAGYLMLRVGTHLSPGDPHELAKTAADGDKLKGALHVDPWPPRAAFPFGALLGLALVYLLSSGRSPTEPRTDPTAQPAEPSAPYAGPPPQR
ncbi:MAG TPA: hypothetical protein VFI19_17510 [Nocardioides sp.]|nr:hypothetical protein [Nocardioides sp.]